MPKRKQQDFDIAGATPEMAGDTTAAQPDRERVAQRAYEKYLERGAEDGRAEEDWFSAEQELSNAGGGREDS